MGDGFSEEKTLLMSLVFSMYKVQSFFVIQGSGSLGRPGVVGVGEGCWWPVLWLEGWWVQGWE
jgi:hypothetical protein